MVSLAELWADWPTGLFGRLQRPFIKLDFHWLLVAAESGETRTSQLQYWGVRQCLNWQQWDWSNRSACSPAPVSMGRKKNCCWFWTATPSCCQRAESESCIDDAVGEGLHWQSSTRWTVLFTNTCKKRCWLNTRCRRPEGRSSVMLCIMHWIPHFSQIASIKSNDPWKVGGNTAVSVV